MRTPFKSAESLSTIPESPGIYLFYNKDSELIYVGKAKRLLQRLRTYKTTHNHDIKTEQLKKAILEFEVILTKTESDALILERQLVKQYQPRYNILLKDDKNFIYIKISSDLFPKIDLVRHKKKDGSEYYGPYPSAGPSKQLNRILHDVFPLRDCEQSISLDQLEPKCINLDIGKCLGPCIHKDQKVTYDKLVDKVRSFLTGNMTIITELRKQMAQYSQDEAFEKAALIKKKILAIEKLHQERCIFDGEASVLILTYAQNKDFHYLGSQYVQNGILLFQKGLYLETSDKNPDPLFQMVLEYLDSVEFAIDEIWTDPEQIKADSYPEYPIKHPLRGLKRDLLDNALVNTKTSLYRLSKQRKPNFKQEDLLKEVQEICQLSKRPQHIVGFDISHYYGQQIVGSAITFMNGVPSKKDYRKYSIRSVKENSNDVASMYEVVLRHLSHCEGRYPDLLLIDGGITQLAAAQRALIELAGLPQIACISLAKKQELLFLDPTLPPLALGKDHSVCQLFQRVRDEAHRFALKFQREKRHRSFFNSQLRSIQGIGKKRAETLEKKFQSIQNIRKQSPETIAKLPHMNLSLAQKILLILE